MGDLAQAVGMILEDSEGVAVKSTQPSCMVSVQDT